MNSHLWNICAKKRHDFLSSSANHKSREHAQLSRSDRKCNAWVKHFQLTVHWYLIGKESNSLAENLGRNCLGCTLILHED